MLSIPAWKNANYLSLEDILLAVLDVCKHLMWRLNVSEVAPEPGAMVLNDITPEMSMNYFELIDLVKPGLQIIDGEVIAEDINSNSYVLIRAVDSTSWDIETNMPTVIMTIKQAFPEATSTAGMVL